jgi:hypothetical protein
MRRNAMSASARASGDRTRPAVSRGELASLAVVVVLLAPLLMLAGGLFSLPSLIERGAASPTAGLSERNAGRAPAAPARVSRPMQTRPQRGQVAPPRTTHRPGLRPIGVIRTTPAPVTRQGIRSTPSGDAGITGTPVSAGAGSGSGSPPEPGKPAPVAPEPPAASVGVNGTTTVTVATGTAPVTATATVSVSPSGVAADVAAADAVTASTAAVTTALAELSPPVVTTTVTAPVVPTAVSILGG